MNATIASWYDTLKNLSTNFSQYLTFEGVDGMTLLMYGAIAFFVGFLVNRYLKSFFMGLLLSIIFIGALYYLEIITIDMLRLNSTIGLHTHDSIEAYVIYASDWVKSNVVLSLTSLLGFMIGYKIS